jgi:hypothetical protein
MGKALIIGEIEIFSAVTHPIQFKVKPSPKLDQESKASKKRGSSTSFDDNHVVVDKEG